MFSKKITGCITALVTPFKNDVIDLDAFEKLLNLQISAGVSGVVVGGTTGESPTISDAEREQLIKIAVKLCKGKILVFAGTGSNSTQKTVDDSKAAQALGVDGVMVVAPYYNKPTQEGLYQHFNAVNEAISIPIIVYNIPGRSVVNISDATLARLANLENIAGLKDATGDLSRPVMLRATVGDELMCMLTGDDPTMVSFNAAGGVGVISVISNIMPKEIVRIQKLCADNDFQQAAIEHCKLIEFIQALFCETNPTPTKYALSLMGLMDADVRLPLVELNSSSKELIFKNMQDLGLL